jgi:hypothetical protein
MELKFHFIVGLDRGVVLQLSHNIAVLHFLFEVSDHLLVVSMVACLA